MVNTLARPRLPEALQNRPPSPKQGSVECLTVVVGRDNLLRQAAGRVYRGEREGADVGVSHQWRDRPPQTGGVLWAGHFTVTFGCAMRLGKTSQWPE